MFTVTKIFKIPIGHRLTKAKSRCNSYHGHNIRVDITVQRATLNNNDMVIDFYDLKKMVGAILDDFDHCMIVNPGDINSLTLTETDTNQRIIKMPKGDPTSENMCYLLFQMLCTKLTDIDSNLRLKSVVIWESDESFAKYEV